MDTNCTCFTLTILDTYVNSVPSLEGVKVSVHQSLEAANEALVIYTLTQIWERFEDELKESVDGASDLNDLDEFVEFMRDKYDSLDALKDESAWMFNNFYQIEDGAFQYRIDETPNKGFFEQLDEADGVVIDGNYICNPGLNNPVSCENNDSAVIEGMMVDDDYNKLDYFIKTQDVVSLTYDVSAKEWSHPEGYQIRFFKMN